MIKALMFLFAVLCICATIKLCTSSFGRTLLVFLLKLGAVGAILFLITISIGICLGISIAVFLSTVRYLIIILLILISFIILGKTLF